MTNKEQPQQPKKESPVTPEARHSVKSDPVDQMIAEQAKELSALLAPQPLLRAQLLEALRTKAWLVTISMQKRLTPDDPHDLHHSYIIDGYPPGDVVKSLKVLAADFQAKNFPEAELDAEGWY